MCVPILRTCCWIDRNLIDSKLGYHSGNAVILSGLNVLVSWPCLEVTWSIVSILDLLRATTLRHITVKVAISVGEIGTHAPNSYSK